MPPGVPMPPPGIRRSGGRTYARGGAVSGPAWVEGNRAGTQVQHTDGKMDGPNIGRGKPITYKKGGRVARKTGGRIYAPEAAHTAMAPHLPGGAGGGLARLRKAHVKHGDKRI